VFFVTVVAVVCLRQGLDGFTTKYCVLFSVLCGFATSQAIKKIERWAANTYPPPQIQKLVKSAERKNEKTRQAQTLKAKRAFT
jgi:hypothetical protein